MHPLKSCCFSQNRYSVPRTDFGGTRTETEKILYRPIPIKYMCAKSTYLALMTYNIQYNIVQHFASIKVDGKISASNKVSKQNSQKI